MTATFAVGLFFSGGKQVLISGCCFPSLKVFLEATSGLLHLTMIASDGADIIDGFDAATSVLNTAETAMT